MMAGRRPLATLAAWSLAGLAAFCMAPPLLRLGLHLELPNEGWNAVHAMRWAGGGALYPPRDAWIVNNYPPLWFLIEGTLGRWTGDPIIAGRAVALAAFLWTGAMIAVTAHALTRDRLAAAVAGLAFAATVAAFFGQFVGLAEPQMLAHAAMASALALAVRSRGRRAIVGAALLVIAGLFVKPVVIAVPIALTFWLAFGGRDRLVPFVATAAAAALAMAALCVAAFGADMIAGLLYPRLFSPSRLATNLALTSKVAVALAVWAGLVAVERGVRDRAQMLVALLLAAALLEIVLAGGALGVSSNVAFDLVIASSLAAAVVVARAGALAPRLGGDRAAALMVAAIVARAAFGLSPDTYGVFDADARAARRDTAAALDATRARLASVDGPVACEALSLCLWAGHLSDVDLWKLRHERTLSPSVDPRPVVARIARGDYAAVVLFGRVDGPAADGNLSGLAAALDQAYPRRNIGPPVSLFLR